jgi:hypothetical protein
MQSVENQLTFQRNKSLPSSELKKINYTRNQHEAGSNQRALLSEVLTLVNIKLWSFGM